jgi:hypothetical protein
LKKSSELSSGLQPFLFGFGVIEHARPVIAHRIGYHAFSIRLESLIEGLHQVCLAQEKHP